MASLSRWQDITSLSSAPSESGSGVCVLPERTMECGNAGTETWSSAPEQRYSRQADPILFVFFNTSSFFAQMQGRRAIVLGTAYRGGALATNLCTTTIRRDSLEIRRTGGTRVT